MFPSRLREKRQDERLKRFLKIALTLALSRKRERGYVSQAGYAVE